jgi:chemotaxis methyl-accepting protein methylase
MKNLQNRKGRVNGSVSRQENSNLLGEWFVKHTGLKMTAGIRENMEKAIRSLASQANISRREYTEAFLNGHVPEQLFVDLVVSQNSFFFSQKDQMDLVVLHLIPSLLKKNPGTPVRILSIGCSQGEEPYSLALLIHDAGIPPSLVDIQGIDISQAAITLGKSGVFSDSVLSNVPVERIQNYFTPLSSDQFQLKSAIRQQVGLFQRNLLADDHESLQGRFDIIFCKNFISYLVPPSRKNALDRIDRMMSPRGFLFLDANSGFMGIPKFKPSKVEGVWLFHKMPESIDKLRFSSGLPSGYALSNGLAEKLNSEMTLHRAESSRLSGHLNQSIRFYNDVIVCHPSHAAQALLGKARVLMNFGEYREALEASELALEINAETNSLDKSRRSALKSLIKNLVKKNRENMRLINISSYPSTRKMGNRGGGLKLQGMLS